ncbi:MAG: substrate-binding domain-containing protein [Gammaproteobacteria bacterium]
MNISVNRRLGILVALLAVSLSLSAGGAERKAFKVCADPNNLPLSSTHLDGFENRIAQLLADDLHLPIAYTWFPQRLGFIRNTLRADDPETGEKKCDIVMGVPEGFELASPTKPYYRSTYAMVFKKNAGLDDVLMPADILKLDDKRKKALRFGVFEQTPAADWLVKYGFVHQITAFPILSGDPNEYPGQLIERELLGDKIDIAILWGPIASYYVKKSAPTAALALLPMQSEPGIKFDFAIAMGVRFGEKEWKQQVETLIAQDKEKIEAILKEYQVPLVAEDGSPR